MILCPFYLYKNYSMFKNYVFLDLHWHKTLLKQDNSLYDQKKKVSYFRVNCRIAIVKALKSPYLAQLYRTWWCPSF